MPSLHIALFGGIQVLVDGQLVTLAYDKVRALLAFLLIEARHYPQRRETLAGLLWPEQSEKEARHSLSQALLKLRQAIDPDNSLIIADRHTVGWQAADHIECDTAVFTTHLQQCQTHPHIQPTLCESCMTLRQMAVSLYKGPFLTGLSLPDAPQFEQWLTQQREQYHRQVMDTLTTLTTYHEQRGELGVAIQYAQQQLAFEPWREETHYQLMRLLLYKGQRSSAIAQYLTCVQTLTDELGVEPSPKTIALFKLIQTANPHPPHNLPTETTPFVGRQTEIAQITSWLAGQNRRLITIVGPGGMGKTRLAQAVAQRQLGRPIDHEALNAAAYAFFTHGVYWVSLVGVETAVSLFPTIAEALGFQLENATDTPIRSAQQQLLDYLRQKRILIVLDNFEQFLTTEEAREATAVLSTILQNAPNVQLLVTSRERLQLPQEQVYHLHGLDYPETEADTATEYTALALFTHTAQRIQPNLCLDHEGQTAVAHVCRLLRGMPLALELAATSINILSPTELATELAHSLDLLATTMRHIPERHRSIRAAFETSWQQLSPSEQSVFQKLSIFRGGFNRAAVQVVADAPLSILTNLINKSFIRFHQETQRYETHELMRQFGEEKLMRSANQTKRAQQLHSAYFAEKLEQWAKEVKGAQQQKAFREMAINSENIRLAWHWAVDHEQTEFLTQAVDGLGFLYQWQGRYLEGAELYQTACQMLRTVAANTSDLNELLLKALTWHGLFMHSLGQAESAIALFEEALKVDEDKPPTPSQPQLRANAQAFLWHSLGEAIMRGPMRDKAKIYLDKSLAIYECLADTWGLGQVYNSLGILARELGDYPVAKELTQKSLALRKEMGDQIGIADSLGWLGLIAMDMGELDQAEAFMLQQLALNRELNFSLGVASSLDILGLLHLFRGQFESAQGKFEDRLAMLNNLGIQQKIGMTNTWLGIAYFNQGMYHKAQDSAQTSLSIVEEAGNLLAIGHAKMLLGYSKLALGEFDKARTHLNACIELFQQLGQRDELSQAWAWMGYVELANAQFQAAQTCLTTCLRITLDIRTLLPVLEALPAIVKLLVVQEEPEKALEIHTMAMQFPALAKSIAFEDLVGQPSMVAAELLPSEVVAAAQERGRQRGLWETAAELLTYFTEIPNQGRG